MPEPVADLEIAGRVTPEVLVVIDVGEPALTVGRAPAGLLLVIGPVGLLVALVSVAEGRGRVCTPLPATGAGILSLGRETITPLSFLTEGRLALERRLVRIAMAYPCPFPPAKSAVRLVMSFSGESVDTSTFCATGFLACTAAAAFGACTRGLFCKAANWVADNFLGAALTCAGRLGWGRAAGRATWRFRVFVMP